MVSAITMMVYGNRRYKTSSKQSKRPAITNTMANPRIMSVDKNGRPYVMWAKNGKKSSDNVFVFSKPNINLDSDKKTYTVSSNDGVYKKSNEFIELSGKVSLSDSEHNVINTSKADVDLKTKDVSGSRPVSGHGPIGKFAGKDGFEARKTESGSNYLWLKGRAKVSIKAKQNLKNGV